MDFTQLETSLKTSLPVVFNYILQKATPEKAQEIITKVITDLQAIKPTGAPVTEQQLYDAVKSLTNGVITVIPDGKPKAVTNTVLSYVEKVADKVTGTPIQTSATGAANVIRGNV